MPRYDVFLSYASADQPSAEHLARKLEDAGVRVFFDDWNLIAGRPVQEALEEALDQSRTCVVLIGREVGPWQNKEMRSAVETHASAVIPVLLAGGSKEKLPRFLRLLNHGSSSEPASTTKTPSAASSPASGARRPVPAPVGEEGDHIPY